MVTMVSAAKVAITKHHDPNLLNVKLRRIRNLPIEQRPKELASLPTKLSEIPRILPSINHF